MLTVCHGQQLLQPPPTAYKIVESVDSKETLLHESQKTNEKMEISELYISITGMSQEVSKWLVNRLKPTYKYGILGL